MWCSELRGLGRALGKVITTPREVPGNSPTSTQPKSPGCPQLTDPGQKCVGRWGLFCQVSGLLIPVDSLCCPGKPNHTPSKRQDPDRARRGSHGPPTQGFSSFFHFPPLGWVLGQAMKLLCSECSLGRTILQQLEQFAIFHTFHFLLRKKVDATHKNRPLSNSVWRKGMSKWILL